MTSPDRKSDATNTSDPGRALPQRGFRTFLHVLVNTAVANITTSYLWFGLTFWIYAETRNVITTGVVGAAYMLFIAIFSMMFGTLVDRFPKKAVMAWATVAALGVFVLATGLFFVIGEDRMANLDRPWFWFFALVLLAGAVVEQLRGIALSTSVTLLVPVERHANANGLVGTVAGLSLIVTSVFSGLSVGFLGMGWTLIIGISVLTLTLVHLVGLTIPERPVAGDADPAETVRGKLVDLRGGWLAVLAVPGLLALILFTTLNNLYSGVMMALIDPYGIDLFGVQGWGIAFGGLSVGVIVGGAVVAWKGLGRNPVRTILLGAAAVAALGSLALIREWGWLLIVGFFLCMAVFPAVEAAEQTVIQRVVPYAKQGRVFGFALTFEAASAPITAILVAPIAQFWVIPYLRTDAGQQQWAWLLGHGENRGIALIMLVAGIACILFVAGAFLSPQYRRLSAAYLGEPLPEVTPAEST